MASRLISVTANTPGINGINLEGETSAMGPMWATTANNCVINRSGKLAARNGWQALGAAVAGTPDIEQVFEYNLDNGTSKTIFTGGGKIYIDPSSPTDITGTLTVTANNWKFQNFNGNVVGFQAGHDPIIYKGSGTFTLLSAEAGASGIVQSNEVLAAWGRLWTVDPSDHSVVKYSDLLIPQDFSSPNGGSIDLQSVWTHGKDKIIALAAFSGRLVIFGERSITVYSGADGINESPSTLQLEEVIYNSGCVARDSVQQVDEDLFYLSSTGVRSLKRDLVRSRMPLASVTESVRTDVVEKLSQEDVNKIRSAYHREGSFYLITFPTNTVLYIIDVRRYASEGLPAIFTWTDINPLALHEKENGDLIMGLSGGLVGKYADYTDNGATYSMSFKSSWIDPYKEINPALSDREMILKRYTAKISSVLGVSPTLKWYLDYSGAARGTRGFTVTASGLTEWGTAEYGVDEWGGGLTVNTIRANSSGSGKVFAFGVTVPVPSSSVEFYGVSSQFKLGRIG